MTIVDNEPAVGRHQPAETPDPAPSRGRRRRTTQRALAVLGAAAVLVGSGYQSWLLLAQHRNEAAARQALDAARGYAVSLTTADPESIDQQISDIMAGSTGDFHDRYAKRSADLRAMLITNGVSTRGTVVDAAVKSADSHHAAVLLFVKQTFTSSALPDPPAGQSGEVPPDVTGMAITLQKVGDRWLVSDVVPAGQLER